MKISRRSLMATTAAVMALAIRPLRAAEKPGTVLITGSNRGIGLEFAKEYAAKGWTVIATTRNPADATELKKLAAANKKVSIEQLDVAKPSEIDALAAKLKGRPIDVLINNAGITGDFRNPKPQSFGTLEHGQADEFMHVNALGPLKVTEALYENVKAGSQKKIVAITSLAGVHGVGYGGVPGGYWYKLSKSALNAAMANVAIDSKKDGVIVALLSPGQVRVEKIGKAQIPGLIEPTESIGGMIKVIDGLTMEQSGQIIRYNGEVQPF